MKAARPDIGTSGLERNLAMVMFGCIVAFAGGLIDNSGTGHWKFRSEIRMAVPAVLNLSLAETNHD